MVKSWKTIKKHESSFDKHCAKNLYSYIKKNPVEYPTNIEQLMNICGITCDFESVKNYQRFHTFLQRHRKLTDEMFSYLFDSGWFEEYKNNGHSEEEIYQRFIDTCLSYEIIPLYCDADNKYYLVNLDSFLLIKKQRLRSAGSEIKHKFDSLKKPMQLLPNTINTELNLLKESPDAKQLLNARDELQFMPRKTTTQRGLTEENIFKKWRYIDIITWLYVTIDDKPIRQAHLIEKLVMPSKNTKRKKPIYIPSWKTDLFLEISNDRLELQSKEKFSSKYGLRRALTRLKRLNIIESYKPKRGYSCLRLTEKGIILFLKWRLKNKIVSINDEEQLVRLLYNVDLNKFLPEHKKSEENINAKNTVRP